MVLILQQIRRSENYWPKRSSTPSRRAQTKYLYSLDRNNNERFGDQGLFAISREIELLRYIPAEPKWKLFRVSARRKKYSSTARTQWSIFAIVKETENSQAAFASSPRTSSEKRRIYSRTEMSRCEWCLDKFSTKRYTDATVVLKRASETLGVEKKKITVLFNISRVRTRGEPFARRRLSASDATLKRRARSENVCFTHEHRLSYHFNGILNSRKRVPKLMQSQFPGSCAWYISDFLPLRYRLESSPSHAAVPERLLSPNNRLLPSANWSARVRFPSHACEIKPYDFIHDMSHNRWEIDMSRKIICHNIPKFNISTSQRDHVSQKKLKILLKFILNWMAPHTQYTQIIFYLFLLFKEHNMS